MTIALVMTMATGCSTVKGAMSALGGGKPHQVTVVNNIEAAPAPQPIVIVQQAPAPIVVEAPVAEITPLAQMPRPKKSRISALKAVASGAVAGALVGTAVGYALDGSSGAAKGAGIGAGAGAVGGAVANRSR